MVKKLVKDLDRAYKEIVEFVEDSRAPAEKINFKKRQLKFLNADVRKEKIPFKHCMVLLERKKQRRLNAVANKRNLENFSRKLKK